ncbi:MAG: hypothetical protein Rubg2KO_16250 [Rubricoccaceae bacterium]
MSHRIHVFVLALVALSAPALLVGCDSSDDSSITTASFMLSSQTVAEGDTASVTVVLDEAASADLVVTYGVAGSADSLDHSLTTLAVPVPAGGSSAVISVPTVNDTDVEGDETLVLSLAALDDVAVGAVAVHTLVITDDD